MVDSEVVGRRVREIGRRAGGTARHPWWRAGGVTGDPGLQAQVERHLQLALQSAIDIALHILAEDTDRTPEDYGGAFVQLAEVGVLDPELAARLRLAAGLRNLLVHAYLDIDPARIWSHLGRLDDLENFARAADGYLAP